MRIGARKNGRFVAVSLVPDVCWTPVGKDMVPIPYQIVATLEDSQIISHNVNFNGDPVFLMSESVVPNVTGNEAGTGGGLKSGVNVGKVRASDASRSVRVNGYRVVRDRDQCDMNLSK